MNTYELYVYCRRNDVSQDSGLHATKEAASDEEAVAHFKKEEEPWLLKWYDQIYFTVKDGDRIVAKWEAYRSMRPDPRAYPDSYNNYGERVQKTTRSA